MEKAATCIGSSGSSCNAVSMCAGRVDHASAGKDALIPAFKSTGAYHRSPLVGWPPFKRDILLYFRWGGGGCAGVGLGGCACAQHNTFALPAR